MDRRELLQGLGAIGLVAASGTASSEESTASVTTRPLTPPENGNIPVAFLISDGAVMIDFAGPWEVFQDVMVPGLKHEAFRLYTVAETLDPITVSGGMKIVPDYTFATAPPPKVLVIPAQRSRTPAIKDWIRKATKGTDVTMSVCDGAFLLASTGLLDGKPATAHHGGVTELAMSFPEVHVKRGVRFVEDGNLATAGGLSSGIDLALHVVDRYYGRDVATQTAFMMEYQGRGWLDPASNNVFAQKRVSTDAHPVCPVCEMDVDPSTNLKSTYAGKTYYFCMKDHKALFDAAPARFT
jgi:putative intracellular protease/amidase/YHS domain-containing protein